MKKLLLAVLLCAGAVSGKAQIFHNDSPCELEFRQICIDASCNISLPTTTWTTAPPHSATPIPFLPCNPGDEIGFEVQYGSTTGCTNPSIFLQNETIPILCSGLLQHGFLGPCGCNDAPGRPNGPDIHFNGTNVHVDN